ncbi:hypothetical protein ES705_45823 [subsurface metagenome]
MAKPKNPLLSLGARGTIADSLTFQKRGREHFARVKPIPKDPKSPAQLARRQIYRDAVAVWNALTPEEKEAWRGICPGLTAYQCFMSSELKYAPPPPPLYIGAGAIDRGNATPEDFTCIDTNGPASASGIIHTVELFAYANLQDCVVGTFYKVNHWTHKCRDSVFIGFVPRWSKETFSGLSIAVEAGDYIGFYAPLGRLDSDSIGFAGVWRLAGEHIDPGDEETYAFLTGDALSLYGIGEQAA